jgi:uncharacterized membrane protein
MAAVDVLTEVLINRPVHEVAEFAADPSNAPQWYANIESVSWQTPPPIAVGSRLDFVAHFLGRKLVYTYEITEFAVSERLVMQTADGAFPMRTTYTWSFADGQTRMTLRNQGEPSGFASVGVPLLVASMRRANRQDLQNLKRILER